ncbi:unnamed protein product [Miscanthus lutarioriparius]|uniref:Protein kinase domain-containing protein n=1 Tax=Miscanthus lutarioriparius TaxID=422564 RepID=A0A811S5S2_9POAL|nr:unnamed protein product [Miscanthus lutarioriparius]
MASPLCGGKTLLLLLVVAATLSLEHGVPVHGFLAASSDCQRSCGNITIPYPFGIGAACSWEPSFNVSCLVDGQGQEAAYLRVGVSLFKLFEIDVSQGEVRVEGPISRSCRNGPKSELLLVPVPPFTVSNKNKLTAIGCAIVAAIGSQDGYTSACGSFCNQDSMGNITECAGIGCCQTSIPSPGNLRTLNASFIVTADSMHISTPQKFSSPCSYAFVADANWFEFDPLYVTSAKFGEMYGPGSDRGVPLVLDWVVGNGTCGEALKNASSYACLSENSVCLYPSIGLGYRCECLAGFKGNPYVDGGCKDIDECAFPNLCSGTCVNVIGSYMCTPHQGIGVIIGIGVGSAAGFMILVVIAFFITQRFKHRRAMKLKQKYFEQNRGQLLQQLVSQRTDIAERMIITVDELAKATNNFDPARELGGGGHGTVYKGILSDLHVVAIKKSKITVQREIDEFINEVAILSQINHRNVVKILGCCLETEVPLLVYEFISNGTLCHHLHVGSPRSLSWRNRLRVASEIASAIAYLHSSLSIPIIHRDIKSSNILLDDTLTSKVSDFGASRYIPLDRTGITTVVQGTIGYLDPVYFYEGRLTDKSDVYSFGVIVVELLTRKKPFSYFSCNGEGLVAHFSKLHGEGNLIEILDPQVIDEGGQEVQAVAALASSCIRLRSEERPTMRQVNRALEGLLSPENHAGANNMLAEEFDENGQMMIGYPSPDEGQSMGESTRWYSLEQESLMAVHSR